MRSKSLFVIMGFLFAFGFWFVSLVLFEKESSLQRYKPLAERTKSSIPLVDNIVEWNEQAVVESKNKTKAIIGMAGKTIRVSYVDCDGTRLVLKFTDGSKCLTRSEKYRLKKNIKGNIIEK